MQKQERERDLGLAADRCKKVNMSVDQTSDFGGLKDRPEATSSADLTMRAIMTLSHMPKILERSNKTTGLGEMLEPGRLLDAGRK